MLSIYPDVRVIQVKFTKIWKEILKVIERMLQVKGHPRIRSIYYNKCKKKNILIVESDGVRSATKFWKWVNPFAKTPRIDPKILSADHQ